MPNNWEEWDKAHGRGGGSSSADKLAAMIKGTLGHDAAPRADHGTHGSVVHRTTKADMKRPAPVKGEKDRADSTRTRIRMAAYQRKKAEAVSQDPTDRRTPKVEQQVNPHKATTAAKIADQVKTASSGDRDANGKSTFVARHGGHTYARTSATPYTHGSVVRDSSGQEFVASYHSSEAAARKGTGMQVVGVVPLERRHPGSPEAKSAVAADRARTRQIVDQRAAAKNKAPSGPSDEQKAAHYKMMSGRAQTASESAKTASDHRDAAKAHERAAELAPSSALKLQHRNLADNHTASAAVEDRAEATRATSRAAAEKASRERAAAQAKESAAARERLAARQAAAKSATQQPNWETLSQRAQSATVLADKSPTKENHQAATVAHQRAADAARGIDDQVAAEHQEMAGRHQVVADSKGRSQSTGKAGSMGASLKSAQPRASKPAAFTVQNMHKALESGGLERRGGGPVQRDFRGNVVQRSSGSGEGRYTLIKDSPDSTRVVVHGDRSTPAGAARHDANQAKAQSALESKGWTVRKSAAGVYGDLRVSPAPKA